LSATVLQARANLTLPVEADSITPDRIDGLQQVAVGNLPILYGREWAPLGDLFAVSGDGRADLVLEGDLTHVKRIGQGMTRGTIAIHGNAGLHLGSQMRGGEITVDSNVGGWAGAHMAGGRLRIYGDAGPMLGSAYPGERRGMTGGVILVEGSAAARVGERMRRGLIAVGGSTGDFPGARMIAGSLFVFGQLGPRAGAGMKRGSIVSLGSLASGVLPTFQYSCRFAPGFLQLYLRYLLRWGMPVTPAHLQGQYQRYTGDINTLGKGEILIYDQH